MEEKKRTPSMNALTYGIIAGVVMIVYSLLLFIANLYMNNWLRYVGYILLIAIMAWGTLDYRKKYMNGFMTYGQAFNSCFMIGLYAAIIGTIYTFLFVSYIHPGLQNEILEQTRAQMASKPGMTDEMVDKAMSYTEKFTTPAMMTIFSLIFNIFWSAVIGLLLGIFLKKIDTTQTNVIQ